VYSGSTLAVSVSDGCQSLRYEEDGHTKLGMLHFKVSIRFLLFIEQFGKKKMCNGF